MTEKMKYLFFRIVGSMLSFVSLVWMPWKARIWYAKFLYKITYVDPRKYPTYMKFIESCNAKYGMGKRSRGAYKNIVTIRDNHEKAKNGML